MRTFLVLVLAFIGLPHTGFAAGSASKKPNVLFLLADDFRPDCIGALGNKHIHTPHLDKLAGSGFIFRKAYCMGSLVPAVCLPSRTMILTGKHLFHIPQGKAKKTEHRDTLPLVFRAAGYVSLRSGKFGNNPHDICQAFDQHKDGKTAQADADNVIAFIREHAGRKPMLIQFAPTEPHDPQFAPEEYYGKYKAENLPLPPNFRPFHPFNNGEMTVRDELTLPWPRTRANVNGKLARYYASISYLDAQIGRILQALRDAGELENTIIVFASDNGLSMGEHGLLGKQNLYENGGMAVPMIFAGPGIPRGNSNALVYLFDIFPTLCDLTGVAIPKTLDGQSLRPILQGKSTKVRDQLFLAYRDVQRSIRDDTWHLIRYPHINKTQLFNLQNDPHELKDLAADPAQAKRVRNLTALLENIQRTLGDPLPLVSKNPLPAEWAPELAAKKDKGGPGKK